MDKKQKQEFNEVLKKYKRSKGEVAGGYVRSLGKGAIFGVALDVIFTGGFGTLAAVTAASFPTLKAMGRAGLSKILQADKRMQHIKASTDIRVILFKQQVDLSVAFNNAVAPRPIDPAHIAENKFFSLADVVEEEVRKLRPAIKVVSGGENNYGIDEYKIIVHAGNKDVKEAFMTLEQARETLKKKIAKDDAQLAEDLAKARAPKPANDVKPPAQKTRRGFNI
ncbi:MAG: hypothetical protein K0R10_1319 [Alphaproteobacteria bacterium]|nr:hypothetical protein [Alphaproteobacteria bacterium]